MRYLYFPVADFPLRSFRSDALPTPRMQHAPSFCGTPLLGTFPPTLLLLTLTPSLISTQMICVHVFSGPVLFFPLQRREQVRPFFTKDPFFFFIPLLRTGRLFACGTSQDELPLDLAPPPPSPFSFFVFLRQMKIPFPFVKRRISLNLSFFLPSGPSFFSLFSGIGFFSPSLLRCGAPCPPSSSTTRAAPPVRFSFYHEGRFAPLRQFPHAFPSFIRFRFFSYLVFLNGVPSYRGKDAYTSHSLRLFPPQDE